VKNVEATKLNIVGEAMDIAMNFERPQTDAELEKILRVAYDFALKNQGAKALVLCAWLIEDERTSISGYRQRAAVFEYMGHIPEAISDLEFVISRGSQEPADFHALGILYFDAGHMTAADAAFTRSLEMGAVANNAYYKNSCHLFRAEARLKGMEYEEAFADAQVLPDRYSTHMPGMGMRSKEQIMADAERELARVEKSRFKFNRDS
jgi:tetratricopeptide (TPR) repeat protein